MAVPRLGYACINTIIQNDPSCSKIKTPKVNNSCIAKTFAAKGVKYVVELARKNLETVLNLVLPWNERHGIKLYRMSSDMFPHLTNPEFINDQNYAYSLDEFDDLFCKIGEYSRYHGMRLTFHPGQFNQIGAKDENVFEKTKRELSAHAEILDRIGCSPDSIIVIHGGGTYNDKEGTMNRWVKQFFELPKNVQDRLVIENCERQYNYKDMLWLSKKINRPVIFDTHHHDCYSKAVERLPDPGTFIHKIVETWVKHGLSPKFHISEQDPEKRLGAHSKYVEIIPDYLLNLVDSGQKIDIMIEAKEKEQAVLYLYSKYYKFDFAKKSWVKDG